MSLSLEHLLREADESVLGELLGKPAVNLFNLLFPNKMGIARLRQSLLELRTPQSLLLDGETRLFLLDTMSKADATQLALELGFPGKEPYKELEEARFLSPIQQDLLLSFFGLTTPVSEQTEHATVTDIVPTYPLFQHQRVAARKVIAELYQGERRVMLHMPTGSGKTRTAMHIVAQHLIQHEPTVVVWLATSEELCEQAAEEFERAWKSLGNRQVQVFRWWGGSEAKVDEPQDGIVIGGLAKLHSIAKRNNPFLAFLGDKTSLVVFDEAHQTVAETYALVVKSLLARNLSSSLLGLSATPGRSWSNRDQDRELSQFFNNTKVTLEVEGYESPIQYLYSEQYLAKPSFRRMPGVTTTVSEKERKALAVELDIPFSILQKLADDHVRNARIIREIQKLVERHRRLIVFAATVDHAILIASVLRMCGVEARDVTSRSARMDRIGHIAWFKADTKDVRVLCNYGILTTGFDAPATSAALIARPTKSLVLYSQMVGRAIRGLKAGGNASAEIVTVIDPGLPGFGDIEQAFSNWEDVW